MRVLEPLSAGLSEIQVLDASEEGLKLSVPRFLPPGALVQIHLKSAIALAEVRYCLSAEQEFHAGVALQDVYWT